MKCAAAVFLFISLALASEGFGVLRPRFPTKTVPPFSGDTIVIGNDIVQKCSRTAAATVPR